MSGKIKDIAGQRFSRLTVHEFVELKQRSGSPFKRAMWSCKCDCGQRIVVCGIDLRSGNTTSCGCRRQEVLASIGDRTKTHGYASGGENNFTGAYRTWRSMMGRCYTESCVGFENYGGRGISVCDRWHDFQSFLADMGERPDGGSIERIDCNGNYEPANCKWIPNNQQARNTRATKWVFLNGKRMVQADAARALGITRQKIHEWLKRPHTIPARIELYRESA